VADFAVAVERVIHPRLQGRPVVIAPEGAARAAVYDMSEEAYRSGVRKQMALHQALRRCPDAAVLPPHVDRYERAMQELLKHALPYSPLIEMTDHNGHLFLDVTGTGRLFGAPPDLAWRIRRTVRGEMGFDPIWSVASNKLVAKVASRTVKPSGESIVRPGEEADFLAPLSVHLIPGIETGDLHRLREFNLTCAGQVGCLSASQLEVVFAKRSRHLYEAVRGIDPSPVLPVGQQPPAVRAEHTFGNDTNDTTVAESALYRLVEDVAYALRSRRRVARRVAVTIDYSDSGRVVRQSAVRPASANDLLLYAAARRAFHRARCRRIRLRSLRLTADRLAYPPAQRALFAAAEDSRRRREDLVAALDAVRGRFGTRAIQTGRTLAA
jgi:DNA polymerase-4